MYVFDMYSSRGQGRRKTFNLLQGQTCVRVSLCRRELSELRDELDEEKRKRMALQVTLTTLTHDKLLVTARLHIDAAHAVEGTDVSRVLSSALQRRLREMRLGEMFFTAVNPQTA